MKKMIWVTAAINILLLLFICHIDYVEAKAIRLILKLKRDEVKGMKDEYNKIEFETDKICTLKDLIIENELNYSLMDSEIDLIYNKFQHQVLEEFANEAKLPEVKLYTNLKCVNKLLINNELVHILSKECEVRLLHQYYWRYVYIEYFHCFHYFITKLNGKPILCAEMYPDHVKLDDEWMGPYGITTVPKTLKVATLSGGYKVKECDVYVSK